MFAPTVLYLQFHTSTESNFETGHPLSVSPLWTPDKVGQMRHRDKNGVSDGHGGFWDREVGNFPDQLATLELLKDTILDQSLSRKKKKQKKNA